MEQDGVPIICPENYREISKDNLIQRYKAYDWLYLFEEINSATMYLILGDKKAALIDTGFGFGKLCPLIEETTSLPLTVICLQGQNQHVLGCDQFSDIYMSEEDCYLCRKNDTKESRKDQIQMASSRIKGFEDMVDTDEYVERSFANCRFHSIEDGDLFDLGGISLIPYRVPGQTKGSLALYCPEKKALFSGASVLKNHRFVYGQSAETAGDPLDFIRALEQLETLKIDTVWPSNGDTPLGKEAITDMKEMMYEWAAKAEPEEEQINNNSDTFHGGSNRKRSPGFKYKYLMMSYHKEQLEMIRKHMKD